MANDAKFNFYLNRQGPRGQKGEKGDRGIQGLQGEKGEQGIPGKNGTNCAKIPCKAENGRNFQQRR